MAVAFIRSFAEKVIDPDSPDGLLSTPETTKVTASFFAPADPAVVLVRFVDHVAPVSLASYL